jgi:hypothetical protein
VIKSRTLNHFIIFTLFIVIFAACGQKKQDELKIGENLSWPVRHADSFLLRYQDEVTFNKYITKIDDNGFIDLYHTCASAGLGGDPYRDGSFEYYISEPQRKNDFKGYGPLIFRAVELEKAGQFK